MSEANDFLMGGGKKSASFPTIGAQVTGTIVRIGSPVQQRDPATGNLKAFANGDPMLQLPVDLQTTERLDSEDDGIRVIYLKFTLRDAVRDAVRASGAAGLEAGGTLTVTFSAQDAPERAGLSGVKRYTATYSPPATNFLMEGATAAPTPAATPTVQAPLVATPPPTSPTDGASPVDVAKSLISLGQPNEVIAQATGLDLAVIAAIRNTVPALA